MPFITQENREKMLKYLLTGVVPKKIDMGDWCFVLYREMVKTWKENPRWTTAHNIRKKMESSMADLSSFEGFLYQVCPDRQEDVRIAYRLAWDVFFELYVMPYELKKRAENGDI